MAGAGGDEWIYVEDAEGVEQAADAVTATATAVGQENTMPSKNPDDDNVEAAAEEEEEKESNDNNDDEKASAQQPPESDNKAAAPSSDGDEYRHIKKEAEYPYQYPDYSSIITPEEEESETDKAYRAYVAAYQRAIEIDDELQLQRASRDAAKRAYMAADYHILEESEVEAASKAYLAAFRRAAEVDDELQIQLASRDKAYRAYVAAFLRATYVAGSAAPASRGRLGGYGGYDNSYYNRTYGHGFLGFPAGSKGYGYGYGGFFGFPGAAYGHAAATGHGFGFGYGGYAALHPYGAHKSYVPSPLDRPFSQDGYYTSRAGEPSPPAMAPTTTTTQLLDTYYSWE